MWHVVSAFAVVVCAALEPDGHATRSGPPESSMSESKGIVYIVEGVGGFGVAPKVMQKILIESGVPHDIRQFHWSHGFGRWHADLTDDENLRRKGSALADAIMDVHVREIGRPVYLVARSGGTALVLRALAELPEQSVERVILLSAAVSPSYDLTPALRAVRMDVVSFWSPKDKLILGYGTSVFGTADGVQGDSAGLVGFQLPAESDETAIVEYKKLRQIEWDASMRKTYNFGTHVGTTMPLFVRHYVAPLVGGRVVSDEQPPAPVAAQ
jgi:pimeloyl-ACP methyl ester carboxylesterase